ncbi:MAG: cytochrome c biogenesis protein CcsA [Leptospiraceae bacterium]|jgi:heme exporter protein C|nr:cytochrome c biogenesis protein CcsA [Leptospiraceae bacterium]MCZ8346017.1 cytochrome c biogenesis protein CcsA [Leptospiraceae bacterium]
MDKVKINQWSSWIVDCLLFIILLIVMNYSLYYVQTVPNVILEQGLAHRIFYFHVPVAWVALYGPLFSCVASITYLITLNKKWDMYSYSLNIISLVFSFGVLFSGPIWALSAWGVSWDWTDARLQSFFILFLSLIGYFIFRSLVTSYQKKMLLSSYLTLLCGVNSILTWGAIRWIDNPGNHPSSVLGKGGMDADMKFGFYLSVFAFHILFLVLLRLTIRYVSLTNELNRLKQNMD